MKKFLLKARTQNGFAATALIIVVIIIAFLLVGTLSFGPSRQEPIRGEIVTTCCDSGSGNECKPLTGENQIITYNGQQYGLLKSRTEFVEGNLHLKDSGATVLVDGKEMSVVLNSSDSHKNFINTPPNTCDNTDTDKYLTDFPPGMSIYNPSIINYCTQIPDDQVIYVCKNNCPTTPTKCDPQLVAAYQDPNLSCYGDASTEYDAYFRLSDYDESANTGIPDFIKNCKGTGGGTQVIGANPTIVANENTNRDNLQLETFKIVGGSTISPWFSPFCKPAIYLYPERETQVSVQVNPVGKMTVTIPKYPENGWSVTAFPNGTLQSNNKIYPYLYYEAQISDLAIVKPEEGFLTFKKEGLESRLTTLLPKLGLSSSESKDFIDYWIKTLPESNYYIIKIISKNSTDAIAPLTIQPKPDQIIRVALHFELSNTPVILKEPEVLTPIRNGFTVVEWGGLIKQNSNHPFTCFN